MATKAETMEAHNGAPITVYTYTGARQCTLRTNDGGETYVAIFGGYVLGAFNWRTIARKAPQGELYAC